LSQLPLFTPAVTWSPTEDYPDLRNAPEISVDLETRDPNLMDLGPGGARGDGEVVGIALATKEHGSRYYPIAHAGGGNLDRDKVIRYTREQLGTKTPKVGAKIIYDLEWLRTLDIRPQGPFYDIQVAEPLIDEYKRSYSLQALSLEYLGEGKDETLLREAATTYGVDPKSGLWKLPAAFVGPYGEADAELPLRIWEKQKEQLIAEDLWRVFELECDLIEVLLEMRFTGVRVDVDKVEATRDDFVAREQKVLDRIAKFAGEVDIHSHVSMARAYSRLGIPFNKTAAGNGSFPKEWLELQTDELSPLVLEGRQLHKARKTYLENMILRQVVGDHVHPEFRQVKDDKGGTVSGRLSSGFQTMPSTENNPEIAGIIRRMFIPEEGGIWCCNDYSQQEPRVTVHYAVLMNMIGAAVAKQRYVDNPDTDYHQLVADMAGITRKPAKTLNLGAAYGMGRALMETNLIQAGVPVGETGHVYDGYHEAVPYVKGLAKKCTEVAEDRGYIITLGGRRCHFPFWEPPYGEMRDDEKPLRREEAERQWPNSHLRRTFGFKALNKLIQGSSADMIKRAMVLCHREKAGLLHLTLHDELDSTVSSEAEARQQAEIMETCMELEVPLKVDVELGPNWGEIKKIN